MDKQDKQMEVPFQILHPNIRTLLDDTDFLIHFRKTLREQAKEDLNTEGLIKNLDKLITRFIAVTAKALTEVEGLDKLRAGKSTN